MKKAGSALLLVVSVAAFLAWGAAPYVPDERHPVEKLADSAVLVKAGKSDYGTGVVFRTGGDGRLYVWTNAHVVEGAVKVKEDKEKKKASISISTVRVLRPVGPNTDAQARRPVYVQKEASIVRYHSVEDLALLKLPEGPFLDCRPLTGKLLGGKPASHVGSRMWLIGAPHAQPFSTLPHRVSRRGVLADGVVYDQTAGPFFPGCSGGPLFANTKKGKKGEFIGLLTRYAYPGSHGIGLYIPARRIHEFAGTYNCLWAVDSSVAPPKEDRVVPFCDYGLIEK